MTILTILLCFAWSLLIGFSFLIVIEGNYGRQPAHRRAAWLVLWPYMLWRAVRRGDEGMEQPEKRRPF